VLVECSNPFGSQNTEWNDFLDVYKLLERLRKKQQSKSGCTALNIYIIKRDMSVCLFVCLFVCLYVANSHPNGWTDQDQTWHGELC